MHTTYTYHPHDTAILAAKVAEAVKALILQLEEKPAETGDNCIIQTLQEAREFSAGIAAANLCASIELRAV